MEKEKVTIWEWLINSLSNQKWIFILVAIVTLWRCYPRVTLKAKANQELGYGIETSARNIDIEVLNTGYVSLTLTEIHWAPKWHWWLLGKMKPPNSVDLEIPLSPLKPDDAYYDHIPQDEVKKQTDNRYIYVYLYHSRRFWLPPIRTRVDLTK